MPHLTIEADTQLTTNGATFNPEDRDENQADGWIGVLHESVAGIRRSISDAGTHHGRKGALAIESATCHIGLAAVDAVRKVRERVEAVNRGFVDDFEKEVAKLDAEVAKAHRLGRMSAVLIGINAPAVEAVETVAVLAERVEAAAGAIGKEPRAERRTRWDAKADN